MVSVERRKVAPFECVVTISGDARALLRQVDVQAAPGLAIDQSALAQHAHRTRRRRVRDVIDVSCLPTGRHTRARRVLAARDPCGDVIGDLAVAEAASQSGHGATSGWRREYST